MRRLGLAVLLLATSVVPGHATPAPDCAPERLPKTPPPPGSAQERLAAEALAACLNQEGTPRPRPSRARNHLRAKSVTVRSAIPESGTAFAFEADSLEIVDAELRTADGRTEFRVASARLTGVELRADALSGTLFGSLPVTLGEGLPSLPVPLSYLHLTDVSADNVRLTARTATLRRITGT